MLFDPFYVRSRSRRRFLFAPYFFEANPLEFEINTECKTRDDIFIKQFLWRLTDEQNFPQHLWRIVEKIGHYHGLTIQSWYTEDDVINDLVHLIKIQTIIVYNCLIRDEYELEGFLGDYGWGDNQIEYLERYRAENGEYDPNYFWPLEEYYKLLDTNPTAAGIAKKFREKHTRRVEAERRLIVNKAKPKEKADYDASVEQSGNIIDNERTHRSELGRDVPNTSTTHQTLMQEGGSVSGLRFPKSEGLGSHASIDELLNTGSLPGEVGVTVTDRTVRFGDVYDLSQRSGVEFSLVTERVDGKLVKRLYSGDAFTSPVPRDSRILGHAHPNEGVMQQLPSRADMNILNDRYFEQLLTNPSAKPQPSRIFWGTGDYDNTLFYPGFGKSYNLIETPKGLKVIYE
ncbi:hypothetical protein [Aliikangiella maris]|uniref:Uncharacterized protein n=2 Tax=Aliikangiella maris TaxID=3162458 RepID=A0ABV2C0A8_9GAMM